jgi:hypothetical protein
MSSMLLGAIPNGSLSSCLLERLFLDVYRMETPSLEMNKDKGCPDPEYKGPRKETINNGSIPGLCTIQQFSLIRRIQITCKLNTYEWPATKDHMNSTSIPYIFGHTKPRDFPNNRGFPNMGPTLMEVPTPRYKSLLFGSILKPKTCLHRLIIQSC